MPRWRKITRDGIQAAVAKEVRSTENLDGLHVFTDAELRARDERIVRATMHYAWNNWYDPASPRFDAIIAAAEAD